MIHHLIGKKAIITVKNTSASRTGPFFTPDTVDIEGIVRERPRWEKDEDVFALSVVGSDVPLRVIHLRNVIAINGSPKTQVEPHIGNDTFVIASSDGTSHHKVTYISSKWACDCTGFRFRKTCRHIGMARAQLDSFLKI